LLFCCISESMAKSFSSSFKSIIVIITTAEYKSL
jgi:hypothetical protein